MSYSEQEVESLKIQTEITKLEKENAELRARVLELAEAFKNHLDIMNGINAHMGYQFSQPLIKARQTLSHPQTQWYVKERELMEECITYLEDANDHSWLSDKLLQGPLWKLKAHRKEWGC